MSPTTPILLALYLTSGSATAVGAQIPTQPLARLASCPRDGGAKSRLRSAPLAILGTVTQLHLIETQAQVEIFARVKVDEELRGSLAQKGLLIRTALPNGQDTGSWVPVPGMQIYALGEPDKVGAITLQPCTADVGVVTDSLNRALISNGKDGHHFPGVTPTHPQSPGPTLPATPTPWWVHAELDGRVQTLRWAGESGDRVVVAQPMDFTVVVARALDADTIFDGLGTDLPVVEGAELSWRAGVRIDMEGRPLVPGLMRGLIEVPVELQKRRWKPSPQREATDHENPDRTQFLHNGLTLHPTPGGPPVIVVTDQYGPLSGAGDAIDGWQPVWIEDDALWGKAWVRQSEIEPIEPAADRAGGVVGGIVGGSLDLHPVFPNALPKGSEGLTIHLPTHTRIHYQNSRSAFAQMSTENSALWLGAAGHHGWIVLRTHAGLQIGEVDCEPSQAPHQCRVVANEAL